MRKPYRLRPNKTLLVRRQLQLKSALTSREMGSNSKYEEQSMRDSVTLDLPRIKLWGQLAHYYPLLLFLATIRSCRYPP